MKLECQSCLLQFDAVGPGPGVTCPRCGSSNLTSAPTSAPLAAPSGAASSAGIAPTIAQPMAAMGGAFGQPPQAPMQPPMQQPPYGQAPQGYGQMPQQPMGYPQQQQQPMYAPPQQYQNPYGAPGPQGGFGPAPGMGFGIAPVQQMGGFGNAQVEAEQRKAMILSVIGIFGIWPLGVFGIVLANQAREAMMRGDSATALAKAKNAQIMGYISIGVLVLAVVGGCLIGFAGAAAG